MPAAAEPFPFSSSIALSFQHTRSVHGGSACQQPESSTKQPYATKQYPLELDKEVLMLEWMHAHDILWNKKCMDYKNTQKNNTLWEEQAKVM